MYAAKTTGALQVARRYARQGMKVVLIRPTSSRRDHETHDGTLTTRNGEDFPSYDVDNASGLSSIADDADVVWIDEPTLWKDEYLLAAEVAAIRTRSIVLLSGLGATSELEPFGKSMPVLIAIADEVNWMSADCDACGGHGTATRSLYIGEVHKDSQVRVGGTDLYRPACPDCWNRLMEMAPEERRSRLKIS
jgi:thymidine kinase